jgi:hypothetical protein
MDSIRCSVGSDRELGLIGKPRQADQCPNPAYETLRELCMEHFRELVIRPTWIKYCQIEEEWHKVENELYNTEVALGLRPGRELLKKLEVSERAGPKRQHKHNNEQLINDDEVNNDI